MSIITVSREFGSGGREVGKRLADALGYAYYDREIVSAIARKTSLDERYVASALEGGLFRSVPIHFGRTFSYSPALMTNTARTMPPCQSHHRGGSVSIRAHCPPSKIVFTVSFTGCRSKRIYR